MITMSQIIAVVTNKGLETWNYLYYNGLHGTFSVISISSTTVLPYSPLYDSDILIKVYTVFTC